MKRRDVFPSRQKALDSLSRKPPYSLLDKEVMALYIEYGLKMRPGKRLGLGPTAAY